MLSLPEPNTCRPLLIFSPYLALIEPKYKLTYCTEEALYFCFWFRENIKEVYVSNPSKQEKSKVSIIIPIYNNEASLTATIRSIQNQNLKDIEIICINDHSNDTSLKKLKNLQKDDRRI